MLRLAAARALGAHTFLVPVEHTRRARELLGVLALESPIPNAFEDEEVRLVVGIAQQISLAIERAQQINRLQFKEVVQVLERESEARREHADQRHSA